MLRKKSKQALALGFMALFIAIDFFGVFSVDAIHAYAIYAFELLFVVFVTVIYRNLEWKRRAFSFGFMVAVFFSLVCGFGIYEFAGVLGYGIPFQMKDPETILFLLLIGPILEEFVFRSALWRLSTELVKAPWMVFLLTSILFSYSHYLMIRTAPETMHGFIRYQAIYTLGLGLMAGGARLYFGLLAAILIHFAFNFGFFFGSI